jgi:phosphoribosylformimino-5-aminoimidazole carboxamide ribotide isomerase
MDLMGGVVVRGIAGRRNEYRPIESALAPGADPVTIGRAFRERLQLSEAYLADLDAIAGAEPAWELYGQLAACGLSLYIDAGLASLEHAQQLASFRAQDEPLTGVIAGLESSPSPEALAEMLEIIGPERFIFSLDLKAGAPLVSAPAWKGYDAEAIVQEALRIGVRRFIVLDLACVGAYQGIGAEGLIRYLRGLDDDIEIISGGGVRNRADLELLAAAGCNAALVASALHDGRLNGKDEG